MSTGFDWTALAEYSAIGLLSGGLLALIALGFVLIYKGTGVINFAMGEFMMLGAYFFYTANVMWGLPTWLALALTLVAVALAAYVLGIDVRRTQALTWVFAGMVGAVAGIVVASMTSLSPALGGAALGVLAVIILGGLDSIAGAIVAGLVVGLAESLTAAYLGGKVRDIVPYAIVLLILLIRPYGLFGTRQIERL